MSKYQVCGSKKPHLRQQQNGVLLGDDQRCFYIFDSGSSADALDRY